MRDEVWRHNYRLGCWLKSFQQLDLYLNFSGVLFCVVNYDSIDPARVEQMGQAIFLQRSLIAQMLVLSPCHFVMLSVYYVRIPHFNNWVTIEFR